MIMAWTTPKIVEIAVGLEINSYACAEVQGSLRATPAAGSPAAGVCFFRALSFLRGFLFRRSLPSPRLDLRRPPAHSGARGPEPADPSDDSMISAMLRASVAAS
jgi:coenzyme PQQ precursor peptide PqqA